MTALAEMAPADAAACLLTLDPGLGGIVLRARASPAREAWIARLTVAMARHRRVGPGSDDIQLFGGLDLAATLQSGRPVETQGLLADLGDGLLVLPMAERLSPGRAARFAAALDAGAGPAILALDEGDAEESVPPALCDRLAFWVEAPLAPLRDQGGPDWTASGSPGPTYPDEPALTALVETALALGIGSLRAPALAYRAAQAALARDGGTMEAAAALAARLVLAPRATQLPAPPEEEDAPPPDPSDAPESEGDTGEDGDAMRDRVLDAAAAAVPPDLLARLAAGAAKARGKGAGAGDDIASFTKGRPGPARRGVPRAGARLDLAATLRAAAPWQAVRGRAPGGRLEVRAEDLRLRTFREQPERVVIFVVDASGSAAMTRLAETKGAVELLLAEAYVRREEVALIAFRGTEADLLLPPTRSLVQAKRRLAALPGGGGTPLAAGLEAALALALRVRRGGAAPHLVLMTDGRANIARNGESGRKGADADATAMAMALRREAVPTLLLDTAPRPQAAAKNLAAAADALYLPLPRGGAGEITATVRASLDGGR